MASRRPRRAIGLLLHAKRILAEFAEIHDSVRGDAISPRGEVRFGLPGTVSEIIAAR
jgi:LysR family nitrogen assimilation transcriptional regulator